MTKEEKIFTTTSESPVCKDGDEWDDLLAKPVIGKATPVKVWWFTKPDTIGLILFDKNSK